MCSFRTEPTAKIDWRKFLIVCLLFNFGDGFRELPDRAGLIAYVCLPIVCLIGCRYLLAFHVSWPSLPDRHLCMSHSRSILTGLKWICQIDGPFTSFSIRFTYHESMTWTLMISTWGEAPAENGFTKARASKRFCFRWLLFPDDLPFVTTIPLST